jgi:integrase
MVVRKLAKSWQYDFTIPGRPRERDGGFKTRGEALEAEKVARERLVSGCGHITFAEAFERYLAATKMKVRSRDEVDRMRPAIEKVLGHRFIEDVDTSAIDEFKATLPDHLAPKSVNQYLIVIGAVLNFMWKRKKLKALPFIPREKVPKKHQDWYTEQERDQLLDGFFRFEPEWYVFFYITMRLGLRAGEVYAISHRQVREANRQIVIDRAVQRGTKTRPAKLDLRKNNEAYTLDVTQDVFDAITWHVRMGYAGLEFLFSKTGEFPPHLNWHRDPLERVQKALGLRMLSHHKVGRHSVASQAATAGTSMKAIQAQLGQRSEASTHRYAHLGSGAQLRVVESLTPTKPPHLHVNVASTEDVMSGEDGSQVSQPRSKSA